MKKKFGAHTHFSPHMTLKCCNITTTVNNASTLQKKFTKNKNEFVGEARKVFGGFVEMVTIND